MIQCKECGLELTPAQRSFPCPRCGSPDRLIIATDQATSMDVCDAARELAIRHYEVEEGLTHIFRIADNAATEVSNGEPIKLLEVNLNTPETGIMPLHFGPSPASGIPYASIIIEVSPNEFEKIQSNELKLPEGWTIGEEFPKPTDVGGT
jgi:predicted RNA-binding Zn-ribbon protein involved in translation (DUF1610 family)